MGSYFPLQQINAFDTRANHHYRFLPNKCNGHFSVDFYLDQLKSRSHYDREQPNRLPMRYSCEKNLECRKLQIPNQYLNIHVLKWV